MVVVVDLELIISELFFRHLIHIDVMELFEVDVAIFLQILKVFLYGLINTFDAIEKNEDSDVVVWYSIFYESLDVSVDTPQCLLQHLFLLIVGAYTDG